MTPDRFQPWLAPTLAAVLGIAACCSRSPEKLPHLKRPPPVPVLCQQAELGLPGQGCSAMDACNVGPPDCEDSLTLVVTVDASGEATSAFVREQRSTEIDACLLSQMQRLPFLPARECGGEAIAGEYVGECAIICDVLGTEG